MQNIEVEVRSFISKTEYSKLLRFFEENAELVKKDYQETYYFDSPQDLRIQKNNSGSKIWLKEGKIHNEARKEIEIKCERKDFKKLKKLFSALGFKVEIKWLRKRSQFKWQNIKVCLDHTKGYGYIIELEKKTDSAGKKETLKMLKNKMQKLGLKPTAKEEFDKKFQYYKKKWRKLINH